MASQAYVFSVRDSQSSPPGQRVTGLTPTWVMLKKLADGSNVSPQPAITEIADGQYKFSYDPVASGEASGQVDAGNTGLADGDRYLDLLLTDASQPLAAAIWSAAARTLTQQAVALVTSGNLVNLALTLRRGDTTVISLTGLGALSGRSKLWFTVKQYDSDADAAAILQVIEGTGLTILNGGAGTANQGSLTVTDAATGALTINLSAAVTAALAAPKNLVWDLQVETPSGIVTLAAGSCSVVTDITRATS